MSTIQFIAQGPEEICLSLEHQNPSKTSGSPFGRKKQGKGRERRGGGSFSLKIGLLGTPCLCRLGATCRTPASIWLEVIDFQNGEKQSRSGSDKKRRNVLQ